MSDLKPIYCPNLPEILEKLQQTEYPWMDTGETNRRIIFQWGQEKGLEKLDFQLVRAAIHHLGPSALETKKAPVAVIAPPPPPTPPRVPRYDWHQYIKSGKALPLTAPDGSRCPPEVLQACTAKQVRDYVREEEKEKKPWLTDFSDRGSQFRR
jgi:hypothetical protein